MTKPSYLEQISIAFTKISEAEKALENGWPELAQEKYDTAIILLPASRNWLSAKKLYKKIYTALARKTLKKSLSEAKTAAKTLYDAVLYLKQAFTSKK